jgi:hypothetical protein
MASGSCCGETVRLVTAFGAAVTVMVEACDSVEFA